MIEGWENEVTIVLGMLPSYIDPVSAKEDIEDKDIILRVLCSIPKYLSVKLNSPK